MQKSLDDLRAGLGLLAKQAERIDRMAATLIDALKGGRKLMTAGNGGSAAEALHLSEELMGRFHQARRPLASVCLSGDATAITCIANDFGYEEVFARQLEGLAAAGDVLLVLSTSGKSVNILRVLEQARSKSVRTLGLLGPPGSAAEEHCDVAITFEGVAAARIQELHLVTIHLLLEAVDREFVR